MPKETFFNLPIEKREKIVESSIEEFKNFSYDTSSINRIVENSSISKGSFYQYFEDKKDLYKYIINLIIEKKLEYMSPIMANPLRYDFFILIKEMYKSGLSFAKENPDYMEIGNKLMADPNHPIYIELIKNNTSKSDEIFELLLKNAIANGELRSDIDVKMVSYLLTSLNVTIVDYYMKINNKREYGDDILELVDKYIFFIQYGISK